MTSSLLSYEFYFHPGDTFYMRGQSLYTINEAVPQKNLNCSVAVWSFDDLVASAPECAEQSSQLPLKQPRNNNNNKDLFSTRLQQVEVQSALQ